MSNDAKKSFILYTNYNELIEMLTDEQTGRVFKAIFQYQSTGNIPNLDEFSGVEKMFFTVMRQDLDYNNEAWAEKKKEKSEQGKTGGRPSLDDETKNAIIQDLQNGVTYRDIAERYNVSTGIISKIKNELAQATQQQSEEEPQTDNKETPRQSNECSNTVHKCSQTVHKPDECSQTSDVFIKHNVDVDVDVNEHVNEQKKGGQAPAEAIPSDTQTQAPAPSQTSPLKKQTRFVKPTIEEVAAYCKQRGNNIDAAGFVNFYESKGWYIGKNKMQNWHAAVYTWEKRAQEQERARASPQNKTHSADYDFNTAGDIGEPLF